MLLTCCPLPSFILILEVLFLFYSLLMFSTLANYLDVMFYINKVGLDYLCAQHPCYFHYI